jgi:IS30 family transposase
MKKQKNRWQSEAGWAIVNHERIYRFIREDKKNGGVLCNHLRHRLKHRKRPVGGKKAVIPDKVSIDLRPDIINQKERFCDWDIKLFQSKINRRPGKLLNLDAPQDWVFRKGALVT